MTEFDPTYLKQKLSFMSDDELYAIIQINASEYRKEAITLVKEEIARRQIIPTVDTQRLAARIEEKKRNAKEWNQEKGILKPAWRRKSKGSTDLFSVKHYRFKRDSPCFFCNAENPQTTKKIDVEGIKGMLSNYQATAEAPCCMHVYTSLESAL